MKIEFPQRQAEEGSPIKPGQALRDERGRVNLDDLTDTDLDYGCDEKSLASLRRRLKRAINTYDGDHPKSVSHLKQATWPLVNSTAACLSSMHYPLWLSNCICFCVYRIAGRVCGCSEARHGAGHHHQVQDCWRLLPWKLHRQCHPCQRLHQNLAHVQVLYPRTWYFFEFAANAFGWAIDGMQIYLPGAFECKCF